MVLQDVHVKERLRHDTQRQVAHRLRHVQPLSWLPRIQHLLGVLHHDARVALDAPLVKGRLNQAALLPVELAISGKQSIAEQPAQINIELRTGEVPRLLDEKVANMFWKEEHHTRQPRNTQRYHEDKRTMNITEERK